MLRAHVQSFLQALILLCLLLDFLVFDIPKSMFMLHYVTPPPPKKRRERSERGKN